MAFLRAGALLMTWDFMTRDISVFPGLPSEVASGPAGMVFSAKPSGLDVTGSLPVLRLRPSIRE